MTVKVDTYEDFKAALERGGFILAHWDGTPETEERIKEETKATMKKILKDIQDGSFAKEFLLDMSAAGGQAHFKAMRKLAAEHPSEKVGKEIRKLYSWNGEDKLLDN